MRLVLAFSWIPPPTAHFSHISHCSRPGLEQTWLTSKRLQGFCHNSFTLENEPPRLSCPMGGPQMPLRKGEKIGTPAGVVGVELLTKGQAGCTARKDTEIHPLEGVDCWGSRHSSRAPTGNSRWEHWPCSPELEGISPPTPVTGTNSAASFPTRPGYG